MSPKTQERFLQRIVKYEVANTGSMAIKATAKHLCPSCNNALRRIKEKKGFFWAFRDRECKFTAPDSRGKPGKKHTAVTMTIPCPECGKPLRQITGKKGKFWGCSRFKNGCKFTTQDKGGKPVLLKS